MRIQRRSSCRRQSFVESCDESCRVFEPSGCAAGSDVKKVRLELEESRRGKSTASTSVLESEGSKDKVVCVQNLQGGKESAWKQGRAKKRTMFCS